MSTPTANPLTPTYAQAYAAFDLSNAEAVLSNKPEQGLNACIECCDRYAGANRVALFWEGQNGQSESYTFDQLQALSAQFANLLVAAGVKPGDRVAGLLPRVPALLITILGTWRAGAVYQPLFTAFGSKAIEHRVGSSQAKLIVTDSANRAKLEGIANLPSIVTVAGSEAPALAAGDIDFWNALNGVPVLFDPVMRQADDPFGTGLVLPNR